MSQKSSTSSTYLQRFFHILLPHFLLYIALYAVAGILGEMIMSTFPFTDEISLTIFFLLCTSAFVYGIYTLQDRFFTYLLRQPYAKDMKKDEFFQLPILLVFFSPANPIIAFLLNTGTQIFSSFLFLLALYGIFFGPLYYSAYYKKNR